MNKVFLMCGIPGSGKSTFCKQHLSNCYYISRDMIRFSLLTDENDDYFSKEKIVKQLFFKEISACATDGRDFVIDATHLTKASRRKILSLLKTSQVYCVYLKTSLKVALERNAKRQGRERVPDKAILEMFKSLEEPSLNEGFEKIFTIEEGEFKNDIFYK